MRKAVTITVSLPPELVEALAKATEELHVSRSLLIQQLLRSYLAERKKQN